MLQELTFVKKNICVSVWFVYLDTAREIYVEHKHEIYIALQFDSSGVCCIWR